MKIFQLFLLILLFIEELNCDLPVHCMRSDVIGIWTLKISKKLFTPSLDNENQTSCGHGFPNKVVDSLNDDDLNIPNFKEIKIELAKDYKIYENKIAVGTWSFVYDQSFILYYKNSILTAPFKYYKKKGNTEAESNCSKTFLGWSIPDTNDLRRNWSCFYGVKEDSNTINNFIENKFLNFLQKKILINNKDGKNYSNDNLPKKISFANTPDNKMSINGNYYKNSINNDDITNNNKNNLNSINNGISPTEISEFLKIKSRSNLENLLKYEHMKKIIEKINSLNLGWKGDLNPQYIGLSFAQLKHKLGLNKGKYSKKNLFDKTTSFIQIVNLKSSENNKKDKEEEEVEEFLQSVEKEINEISDYTQLDKNKIQEYFENEKEINSNNYSDSEKKLVKENSRININLINTEKSKEKINQHSNISNQAKENLVFENKNSKTKMNKDSSSIKSNLFKDGLTENMDSKSNIEDIREKDSFYITDYKEISKYLDSDISKIDEKKLPRNWDWRNIGGVSYLPPVRSQGSCGSCYVFSTMASLEARLRIKTNNKDKTLFSKQFPLSCNFYAEGCNGGYPILVAKFLQEFEAVPESCFEYTESNDKCSNVCDFSKLKKKYTVSRWGYLGGAYGKTSEADIMKELRARGPIPGNIIVHWSFHFYKSGVFSSRRLKKNCGRISKSTLLDSGRTWAKVEHSITLVGYGEENGVKYWIGMNTWGDNWGEDGYFKILKGENEAEIETMGDFMNINIEDRD